MVTDAKTQGLPAYSGLAIDGAGRQDERILATCGRICDVELQGISLANRAAHNLAGRLDRHFSLISLKESDLGQNCAAAARLR